MKADSHDYGFDFDEEELGRELLTPLPASVINQPVDKVEAEELDSNYQLFIS